MKKNRSSYNPVLFIDSLNKEKKRYKIRFDTVCSIDFSKELM